MTGSFQRVPDRITASKTGMKVSSCAVCAGRRVCAHVCVCGDALCKGTHIRCQHPVSAKKRLIICVSTANVDPGEGLQDGGAGSFHFPGPNFVSLSCLNCHLFNIIQCFSSANFQPGMVAQAFGHRNKMQPALQTSQIKRNLILNVFSKSYFFALNRR